MRILRGTRTVRMRIMGKNAGEKMQSSRAQFPLQLSQTGMLPILGKRGNLILRCLRGKQEVILGLFKAYFLSY
jgi:hypothetical protein